MPFALAPLASSSTVVPAGQSGLESHANVTGLAIADTLNPSASAIYAITMRAQRALNIIYSSPTHYPFSQFIGINFIASRFRVSPINRPSPPFSCMAGLSIDLSANRHLTARCGSS